jgi:hypothetical protein
VLLKALVAEELRNIQSGKRVTARTAKRLTLLIRGAMLEDMALALRRAACGAAHERGVELQEAAMAANIVLKLGDHIAIHLDDKPATLPRGARFISSNVQPNEEIPAGAGQPQLSAAEGRYEDFTDSDAP